MKYYNNPLDRLMRLEFPYHEAAFLAVHFKDDSHREVLHVARTAFDGLQYMIEKYNEVLKERDILLSENEILKKGCGV